LRGDHQARKSLPAYRAANADALVVAPLRPADTADLMPLPSVTMADDRAIVLDDDTLLRGCRGRDASSGQEAGRDQGEQFHGIFSCVQLGTEAK
jgi:hypothetical protein